MLRTAPVLLAHCMWLQVMCISYREPSGCLLCSFWIATLSQNARATCVAGLIPAISQGTNGVLLAPLGSPCLREPLPCTDMEARGRGAGPVANRCATSLPWATRCAPCSAASATAIVQAPWPRTPESCQHSSEGRRASHQPPPPPPPHTRHLLFGCVPCSQLCRHHSGDRHGAHAAVRP